MVSADPLTKYREVNVFGTDRLARMAANSGVKRLIYVSTIKVNGEETAGKPFTESDPAEGAERPGNGTADPEAEEGPAAAEICKA